MEGVKKIMFTVALLVSFVVVVPDCAQSQTPAKGKPIELRWGASYVGTVGYMTAASLAPLIKKYTDGRILISVTPTRGTGETAALLVRGEIDMGGIVPSYMYDMYHATGAWKGKKPFKGLTGFMEYTWSAVYWLVRADSNIKVISDLRGKKMFVPAPGSVGAIHADRLLRAAGLEPGKDIKIVSTSLSAQGDALKDRTADVISLSSGAGSPSILELASTLPLRLLNIPSEIVRKIDNEYNGGSGIEFPLTIPSSMYPGLQGTAQTLTYANPVVVRPGISDDVWYNITKVLWEHKAELESRYATNKTMDRELQSKFPAFVPLNSGVKRYYKEVGWTELLK